MSLWRIVSLHRLGLACLVLCAAACSAPAGPTPLPVTTAASPAAPQPADFPSPTPPAPARPAASPTPAASPASTTPVEPTPAIVNTAPPPTPEAPQLAFLKDGDIWLLDHPESRPYQLTLAGDLLSFAWSPDGERLAAFNGTSLCFFHRDGSVRTACLELGLTETQAQITRNILWSPDGRWIVLWNPLNPQDEDAIGWLAVALDTTNAMWRIQDPVDWGAELAPNNEPGGFTGEPLFLASGQLVGTLSHRYLCGSGGCRYQLYEFDLTSLTPSFTPFPNDPAAGWSEGRNLHLSPDGRGLTNYGAFVFGCDSFHTFVDRFDLATQARQTYSLEGIAVDRLAFAPDQETALLAQTAGCTPPEATVWSQTCGLSQGLEVLPMLRWELESAAQTELPPGLEPAWSPDGEWVAFRSCLAEAEAGEWAASEATPASIYLLLPDGAVLEVAEGAQPAWRPR